MRVKVNGEPQEVPEGATVRALVLRLGANPEAVAVALNGEVVPRGRQDSTPLAPEDRVEIIRAVGGG